MKRFTMKIAALGLALCTALGAYAQTGLGQISGYFRISNAETGNYVEVTGPFTADPTVTSLSDAEYKAGTVIYVEAAQADGSEQYYRVTSLRSQGIEVVGTYMEDYYDGLFEALFTEQGFDNMTEAMWNMVRAGFSQGYISIGRAAIQSVIYIVAQRLDKENIADKEAGELASIADSFNQTVAKQIDLDIRLEPVEGAENTFRLFYEVPNLQSVSEWYNQPTNTAVMKKGFAAMRQYLTDKMGVTGEGIDNEELQEMADWGYDLPDKYKQNPSPEGVYMVSYEQIFADPELLFNWLKLNVIKFTNPERCPDIELQGISLKAVSKELQNHRLTQQIISYLPKVQTEQRIYLCDGKNGVTGHFDFTSAEGAESLDKYAQWVLNPIDNNTQVFKVKHNTQLDDTYYSAVYYDFPVSAADDATTVNNFSSEREYSTGYLFVSLLPTDNVPLQTAFMVTSTNNESQLNVADGVTNITELQETPTSFVVSDKVANKQYVRRRAAEADGETEATETNTHLNGILLATNYTAEDLKNYKDIDMDETQVYFLTGTQTVAALNNATYVVLGLGKTGQSIGPNIALYTPGTDWYPEDDIVLIGNVKINVEVGESEPETKDESDYPENPIKITQAFDGEGPNTFPDLVNFNAELTYGTDFTVTVSTPEHVDDSEWVAPENTDNLSESYLDAFLLIQPNPFQPGEAGYSDYVPGLYKQYTELFEDESASEMKDDFVDGFYLASHLDADETAVLEDGTSDDKGWNYSLSFDAPCSGLYLITVAPVEGSGIDFTPAVHRIKIYPNLYAKFGSNQEAGFNIDGYGFEYVKEENKYVINLPKTITVDGEEQDYDLTNLIGYTPGTYFASSITATAGEEQTVSKIRRRVDADGSSAYYVDLPDLTSIVDSETPLTVNIAKNGVSASYDFYVKQSDSNFNISTGVDSIDSEEEGEAVYYNLQGVQVANPDKGIFVKVVNGNASKVVL